MCPASDIPGHSPDETERLQEQRQAALLRARQLKSGLLRIRLRCLWLNLLIAVRRTQLRFDMWPPGIILAGAIASGLIALVTADQLTGSAPAGLVSGGLVATATAAALYGLLYKTHVVSLQHERDHWRDVLAQRRVDAIDSLTDAIDVHQQLKQSEAGRPAPGSQHSTAWEARQQQRRQQQLRNQNWAALQGEQFLNFVIDVVEELGLEIVAAPSDPDGLQLLLESDERTLGVVTVAPPRRLRPEVIRAAARAAGNYPVNAVLIVSNRSADPATRSQIVDSSTAAVPLVLIDDSHLPDLLNGRLRL